MYSVDWPVYTCLLCVVLWSHAGCHCGLLLPHCSAVQGRSVQDSEAPAGEASFGTNPPNSFNLPFPFSLLPDSTHPPQQQSFPRASKVDSLFWTGLHHKGVHETGVNVCEWGGLLCSHEEWQVILDMYWHSYGHHQAPVNLGTFDVLILVSTHVCERGVWLQQSKFLSESVLASSLPRSLRLRTSGCLRWPHTITRPRTWKILQGGKCPRRWEQHERTCVCNSDPPTTHSCTHNTSQSSHCIMIQPLFSNCFSTVLWRVRSTGCYIAWKDNLLVPSPFHFLLFAVLKRQKSWAWGLGMRLEHSLNPMHTTLRHWDIETLRHWDTETLRHWDTETLRHWDIETLRHWDWSWIMHSAAAFDDSAHYIVHPIESTNCLMLAQFQLEWSSFRIHSRQPV